jgi:CBS domain-containing protein
MAGLFRTILSPIDFDANSLRALDTAAELARLAGATVVVLHVLTPGSSAPTPAQLDALVEQERIAKERLAGICSGRLGDIPYEIVTRTGDPAICIIRAEEELNVDLVVIATHASRKRPRPFPGSVAERIIRESICPVVTVRPSAVGDPDAVGTHMTSPSTTISIDTTIARVQQMMAEDRLKWFPVITGSEVVGIVTDRDIASCYAAAETTVGAMMTREVITVSPRTSLQEAARLLLECDIDGLPVVDKGKLVGVITRSDILKVFADVEEKPHLGPRRVLGGKSS